MLRYIASALWRVQLRNPLRLGGALDSVLELGCKHKGQARCLAGGQQHPPRQAHQRAHVKDDGAL
eukprot:2546164-Pyramimonas_sp.AAC.1